MTMIPMLLALLAAPAHADDTTTAPHAGDTAPALSETQFRGKMATDPGLWRYGHITLTDVTVIIETHHGPFKVVTESRDIDTLSTEFKTERGLFRGTVTVKTTDAKGVINGEIAFRCPSKRAKALTEALKERALARKRGTPAAHEAPQPEERKPESTTTTTTTTTTTGR